MYAEYPYRIDCSEFKRRQKANRLAAEKAEKEVGVGGIELLSEQLQQWMLEGATGGGGSQNGGTKAFRRSSSVGRV